LEIVIWSAPLAIIIALGTISGEPPQATMCGTERHSPLAGIDFALTAIKMIKGRRAAYRDCFRLERCVGSSCHHAVD
jgi:hypothetical protein